MHFDVPKLVRSPGCDHGHDEESRNGRDIKIDILDDYIWTPEWFRVISEKTGVPGGYRNPPGKYWALVVLRGERGQQPRRWRPPLMGRPNWTREGGRSPSFPLPLLPSPFHLLVGLGKGGVLLLLGGLPLLGVPQGPTGLPPCSFIYRGRGAPLDTS